MIREGRKAKPTEMLLGGTAMNMQAFGILTLTFSLLALNDVQADEIIGETEDRTAGQSAGGMTGMMVGAIGGPIGALIGAGVGALVGTSSQEASGNGEHAYQVRTDSGKVAVRSPNRPYSESAGNSAALAGADGGARALR